MNPTPFIPLRNEPVILLAEDEPNDVMLMRLAMQKAGVRNPLISVEDGTEMIEYMSGRCADHPVPSLLLIDLKMPKLDGFGVLAWLQKRPYFDAIARVVLSSSNLQWDIDRAKKLGADEFLTKPNNNNALAELIFALHSRWLARAEVPRNVTAM